MSLSVKHFVAVGATLLALAVVVLPACGQASGAGEGRDRVELASGQLVTGRVLEESWRSVKVDKDLDGKPDEVFTLDRVRQVIYGARPQYLLDALLLRPKADSQQQYIDALKRAYSDKATSKWQLQHAYYDIAKEYEKLSNTNDEYIPKALDAYQKLLDDIPDSRYAPALRMDLGDMFLTRGNLEQARKNFQGAIGSGYGPDIEMRARFRQAQTYLLEKKPDQAETAIGSISPEGLGAANVAHLTVMKADILTARGQYEKAYDMLLGVVKVKDAKDKKPPAVESEAYVVFGDILRLQGKNEEALLAYLRVHLMYADVDAVTHARALVGAIRTATDLNRKEQSRDLHEELAKRFPGAIWENSLKN